MVSEPRSGYKPRELSELALQCINALHDRNWDGDAELVDQLQGALGRGPTPLLRPIPVDLEELAGVLEGDPMNGGDRLDLQTGQAWPRSVFDDAEFGEDDPEEAMIRVGGCGSARRGRVPAIATWSCSSPALATRRRRTG